MWALKVGNVNTFWTQIQMIKYGKIRIGICKRKKTYIEKLLKL